MSAFMKWSVKYFLCLLVLSLPQTSVAAPTAHEKTIESGMPGVNIMTGRIRVPEKHGESGSDAPTIELAYVRVQRAKAPTREAHVLLAGGPGDSAVEQVLQLAQRGGPEVLALFDADIIGIEQRGAGQSTPSLKVDVAYGLPLGQSGSPEAWLPRMHAAVADATRQLRARGIRLEAYNSRESADDVDMVRRALGYETVTLWGRSYGTHLALAVLRRHPGSVRRLVLVSPEGPDDTWKSPMAVDAALDRYGRSIGDADLVLRMRRVISGLAAKPVTVDVMDPLTSANIKVELSAFDLQWLTAQALADPRTLATLPEAYRAMANGEFGMIARIAVMARRRAGIGNAIKPLMDIASGATAQRAQRIDNEAMTALLGIALNFPDRQLADAWGAEDLGDAFRAPIVSDVPALVFVGDVDMRTPVDIGIALQAGMPSAHLVVLKNVGHRFDLFGDTRLRKIMHRFIQEGKVDVDQILLDTVVAPGAEMQRR